MPDLPINLGDLLRQRTVEGERIEYKSGWNSVPILRTLCAFASDFENLGGGYIVIGQDCDADGRPVFPPAGLNANQIDRIQRDLLAFCNLIRPTYFPILSVERYEGRNLIVLWAPGGQNRPYKAPRDVTARQKEHHYFDCFRSIVCLCSTAASVYTVSSDRGEQARSVEGVFRIRLERVREYRIRSVFVGFGRLPLGSGER